MLDDALQSQYYTAKIAHRHAIVCITTIDMSQVYKHYAALGLLPLQLAGKKKLQFLYYL